MASGATRSRRPHQPPGHDRGSAKELLVVYLAFEASVPMIDNHICRSRSHHIKLVLNYFTRPQLLARQAWT
jgi:hypothetical protein